MDLVRKSLDTVFKEIKSLSKRENVCLFMLDAAQQSAKLHDEGLEISGPGVCNFKF